MTPNYLYDHSANLILYWERQGTFWRHLDISYRFLCIWHVCKMSVGVVMVITERERETVFRDDALLRVRFESILCWSRTKELALNTKIIYHHCAMTNFHAYLIHVSKYYYYTQQFMWSLVRKKIEHPLTWPSHCA